MDKKKTVRLIAVLLIFLTLVSLFGMLTAREKNSLNFLEKTVRVLSWPFQKAFDQLSEKSQLLFIDISELSDLREENSMLKKEMSMYRYEIDLLKKAQQENIRFRELLEYKKASEEQFDLALARVTGTSSNNWQRTIYINLGSKDGIEKNMVVINHQGLIGKIINVAPKSSEILLILDSDAGVGARLSENRKTIGIVQGQGVDHKNLAFVHLPKEMEIQVGDSVITSGLGAFYPPELDIGKVVELIESSRGFTKAAYIETSVDFDSLEEVFVIKNFYEEELE